jgi:hypothetical protein
MKFAERFASAVAARFEAGADDSVGGGRRGDHDVSAFLEHPSNRRCF